MSDSAEEVPTESSPVVEAQQEETTVERSQSRTPEPTTPTPSILGPRGESFASSTSSHARALSPSSHLSTTLFANGEKLTWPEDWNRIDEQLTAECAKYSISVMSPETVSSMVTKHVVYTVKTDPTGFIVRRRYNDFQWLRETLVNRYTGLFIPALPATTSLSTKTAIIGGRTDVEGDFVKSRMAQLHMFTQQLGRIPFLRTDPSLHAFLSIQSEKDFKTAIENGVEKLPAYENWPNTGLEMWFSTIEAAGQMTVDVTRTIGDFHRQLDAIRTALDLMDRECRTTGRKAVHLATAMAALTEQTVAWQKVELDLLDPNKNEFRNPRANNIRVLMNQLAAGQVFWSNTVSMIPKIIARVYLSGVQFQYVQVEALRQLLHARDAVLKDLEKAEKEKLKAFEEKEKFKTNPAPEPRRLSMSSMTGFMKPKTLQDYEDAYQKKVEIVDQLFQQQDRMTKGLIYCEIDRFCRDRLDTINTLLGSLAAINLEVALNTNIKWTEVVATAGLDTEQFREIVGAVQHAMDDEEIFMDA